MIKSHIPKGVILMLNFNKKILVVGFGSVSQCTLPILFEQIKVPYSNVTIIDFEAPKKHLIEPWINKGVHFVKTRLTESNFQDILATYLSAGDLFIDLAWNMDVKDLLTWCHKHDVLYMNTSIEMWNPYDNAESKHPTERTLYWRQMRLREMMAKWKTPGPSAVLEHGANPGLISHFTKQGLVDIANRALADKKFTGKKAEDIRAALKEQAFNKLAMLLGVKVIHVSERDTQISNQPKEVGEFVNTWSVEGFHEEGTTTAELGWGTHEKELPTYAVQHTEGPKNQICLSRYGINTFVTSFVPNYTIRGMIVRHGEAFTLSDRLSVYENGKAIYRPTVHYAYCPCDDAITSLHELRGANYKMQPKIRILRDEITSGNDILGALIMGHPYKSWWVGSDLSIEEARRLVPHQNATTVQVAIGVVTACMWMIENPAKGVCFPEDLPHEYVLKIAKPYLGKWISEPFDWTPLKDRVLTFKGFNKRELDLDDPWQFKNFLVNDID